MTTFVPATSMLEMIGNTPVLRIKNMDTGPCELYLKLENQNPGGSIKDRIALAMIEAAEADGHLRPGMMLVEATAGNTGISLAMVAARKNYPIQLFVPDKMSKEKIFHLKALGAQVTLTPSNVAHGHPDYYQDRAKAFAAQAPGRFFIDQFNNPANPAAHERATGPEIWQQMNGDIDAVVCGMGSGGTMVGLGRYFARTSPKTEMVLADPVGSILAPTINGAKNVQAGSFIVEGIGQDFIVRPEELQLIKRAYSISDAESIIVARLALLQEGVFGGSSSGALLAAALRYCKEQTSAKRVLTFVCDSGAKYLSKIYNEDWLRERGFTV